MGKCGLVPEGVAVTIIYKKKIIQLDFNVYMVLPIAQVFRNCLSQRLGGVFVLEHAAESFSHLAERKTKPDSMLEKHGHVFLLCFCYPSQPR